MDITVRTYKDSDFDSLVRRGPSPEEQERYGLTAPLVRAYLERYADRQLIAEHNGAIAGNATAALDEVQISDWRDLQDGVIALLRERGIKPHRKRKSLNILLPECPAIHLSVQPAYWNTPVTRKLVECFEGMVRERGFRYYYGELTAQRLHREAVFERLGYDVLGAKRFGKPGKHYYKIALRKELSAKHL